MSTKIHVTCDALGNPTSFCLSAGHVHDLHGADVLLPKITHQIAALLADKAYDAKDRVLDILKEANVKIVIPPKINRLETRDYDCHMYKWRHLIENMFQKLKQYRAIATRYDKRASSFLGGIHLAAIMIWLN